MAVVTGAIAAGVGAVAAGVGAVSSIKRGNAQKAAMEEQTRIQKKQAADNVAELTRQQKLEEEGAAKEADASSQNNARARQRAIAAGAQGRSGTILSTGSVGAGVPGLGASGAGKTLLGS